MTKYRAPVFTDEHLHYLEQVMREVCEQFECELIEFNGGVNHVHLLVNSLKGVSLRYLHRDFPKVHRYLWRGTQLWSGSYFAGSVAGAP